MDFLVPEEGDQLFAQGLHKQAVKAFSRTGDARGLQRAFNFLSTTGLYAEAGEYAMYLDDNPSLIWLAWQNLSNGNKEMAKRLFRQAGDDERVRFLDGNYQ